MKTDLGTFPGTAAARLLRSHQADARYSAGLITALCVAIFFLTIWAASTVPPITV